jgi:exonuclease III
MFLLIVFLVISICVMFLLTLNIRGIGGTLKVASVCRLLDQTRLDIVFLQEIMVHE